MEKELQARLTANQRFAEYRLYGSSDPRSWAWFVRNPLDRGLSTDVTLDAPFAYYLVIAAGTNGANGPHAPSP